MGLLSISGVSLRAACTADSVAPFAAELAAQLAAASAFRTIATSGTLGTGEAPKAFAVLFFVTRELLDPFFIFESRTIYAVYEFLVSQLAEISLTSSSYLSYLQ